MVYISVCHIWLLTTNEQSCMIIRNKCQYKSKHLNTYCITSDFSLKSTSKFDQCFAGIWQQGVAVLELQNQKVTSLIKNQPGLPPSFAEGVVVFYYRSFICHSGVAVSNFSFSSNYNK